MDEPQTSRSADWLIAQQKYWDAWLDLTRQTLNHTTTEQSPSQGAEALLKWWEAVSAAAPPPTRDLFGRLVGMSQPYFEMAEQFAADTTRDTQTALDRWLDSMEQALNGKSESASASAAPAGAGSYRAVLAFWELPLDNWRRSMASLSPVPGDPFEAMKADGLARMSGGLRDRANRFLAIPAVGYTRETQEQYQRLTRLNVEYLEALQAYNLAFIRLAARSVEGFRAQIDQAIPQASSLRGLYDLWVDACEDRYREYVMSEEYALLYARLVNALAAVKRQTSVLMDEMLEGLNLPTRREIDTMHRYIHRARRENHALRAEIERIKSRLPRDTSAPTSSRRRPRRKTKHH